MCVHLFLCAEARLGAEPLAADDERVEEAQREQDALVLLLAHAFLDVFRRELRICAAQVALQIRPI